MDALTVVAIPYRCTRSCSLGKVRLSAKFRGRILLGCPLPNVLEPPEVNV